MNETNEFENKLLKALNKVPQSFELYNDTLSLCTLKHAFHGRKKYKG